MKKLKELYSNVMARANRLKWYIWLGIGLVVGAWILNPILTP